MSAVCMASLLEGAMASASAEKGTDNLPPPQQDGVDGAADSRANGRVWGFVNTYFGGLLCPGALHANNVESGELPW